MKLWILLPIHRDGFDPWEPWYDKAFGFVVRAETENEARQFANRNAGDENWDDKTPWLDGKYSTCDELVPNGEAGVVLRDFNAA